MFVVHTHAHTYTHMHIQECALHTLVGHRHNTCATKSGKCNYRFPAIYMQILLSYCEKKINQITHIFAITVTTFSGE